MRSTFTWLDYSERDRRRMVDVIEALRETEARDELGTGGLSCRGAAGRAGPEKRGA